MSKITCRERPPNYDHTPDHQPTFFGEKGYCKICLEYDFTAFTARVDMGGVHLGLHWTPCVSALEIEARLRRAEIVASKGITESAAPSQPAPAATPVKVTTTTDYSALLEFARNELAINECKAIKAICAEDGRLPLSDLALLIGWELPCDVPWSAFQGRLNKKLRKPGWNLQRRKNEARLEHL